MKGRAGIWFPFYVADWLADDKVAGLSYEAKGAYIDLLCYMWRSDDGWLPVSRVEKILGADKDPNFFNRIISELLDENDPILRLQCERIASDRLLHEKEQAVKKSLTAKQSAGRRWKPTPKNKPLKSHNKNTSPKKCERNANAMRTQCDGNANHSHSNNDLLTKVNKSESPPAAPTKLTESLGQLDQYFDERKKSRHFEHRVGDYFKSIKAACDELEVKPRNGSNFNPFQWVQVKVNEGAHPAAIDDALKGLVQYWDDTEKPWAYVDSIYKTKKQNYNEKEAVAFHEAMKTNTAEIARILGFNIFSEA